MNTESTLIDTKSTTEDSELRFLTPNQLKESSDGTIESLFDGTSVSKQSCEESKIDTVSMFTV